MSKANNYLITLVELPSYQDDADHIFSDEEQEELAEFLAANPHFGDVIPGTGGIRKLRWRAKGKGKRGGARIIYYFRDLNTPVFLLAVYSKGEKINLTMAERAEFRAMVEAILSEYGNRRPNIRLSKEKSSWKERG